MKKWLAVVLACQATSALAGITQFELGNGMHVIVQEDHRSPVVVSQLWYRVGSIDEENGTTGISHMLEHMMFKGTKDVPDGEFSRLIAAAGGRENAMTNQDYTVYFEQLQKDRLALAFRLEADRMQHLDLAEEGFRKENQVVMEERRMRTEDQPQALVYENLMATTFEANPYRRPVIGWMDDIRHLTLDEVRQWYQRWYTPDNVTLVVAGDVSPDDVRKLANQYFGAIPAHPLPVRKEQTEPEQTGIKRIVVKAPAKVPYLLMAWHAPYLHQNANDWQPWALKVLSGVLDSGAGSRFGRVLVREQQVASEVGAEYDLLGRGPGLFVVDGTPSAGKTVTDLETAIRAQIADVAKNGIREDELARVKAQVIANNVYQRDSVFYQAMLLGQFATVGLPATEVDRVVDHVSAVTAAQVQEVARRYLVDDQLTVATLDPQPWNNHHDAPPVDMHQLR